MSKITIKSLGQPISIARTSEIYVWKENQILKLFFPHVDLDSAKREFFIAREANTLAVAQVAMHEEVIIEGRYGIVMDYVDGQTLTLTLEKDLLRSFRYAKRFARLHAHMHAAQTTKLKDIRTIITEYVDSESVSFLDPQQKTKLIHYIQSLPEGNSLLHMDYHTDNVLVSNGQDIPIDWATGAQGDSAADLAMTYYLFSEAELFPGITRVQAFIYNLSRSIIYSSYKKEYLATTQMPEQEFLQRIGQWYLPILVFRLVTFEAPTEIEILKRKITESVAKLP